MNATGVDLAVRASRPRGITDALAEHLAVQVARNDRLQSELSVATARIKRLEDDLAGTFEANQHAFREMTRANREVELVTAERDAAHRRLRELGEVVS